MADPEVSTVYPLPAFTPMPITIGDLTNANVHGAGVFDVLMRANKAHLEQEFLQGRIKGPEYATVYLGALEAVMSAALSFLLQKDKVTLEAKLVDQQIELAKVEITKANAQVLQIQAQTIKVQAETTNLGAELLVLQAQKCKLDAEYDLLLTTNRKTAEEIELLKWKAVTERAQTSGAGVDVNSVIGKQMALYGAQADGFKRDAEQKAAKVMVDSWNVRRTTDEGTVADGTNQLNDASVGRAVSKLLSGVGA